MNVKIRNRNFDLLPPHEKVVNRQVTKVRKLLPSFPPEVVELDVGIEKLVRGNQFKTVLTLTIPQRVIRAEEIEDNPSGSIIRAFDELVRRLKRFKSQLSREQLWHRQTARVEFSPQVLTRDVEESISANLEKIENYIRRELYHFVLVGQVPPGIVEPQALVDEVFLEVSARSKAKPTNLSQEQWMFQLARNRVQARIRELEEHRDEAHIEEDAVRQSRWEDEDLNFYQPDENLRVEDLLPDGNGENPEEILAREEVEEQLRKGVALLPGGVRESFVLFALEGFTSDEVAMITGKEPARVLADVEEARQFLRRELKF